MFYTEPREEIGDIKAVGTEENVPNDPTAGQIMIAPGLITDSKDFAKYLAEDSIYTQVVFPPSYGDGEGIKVEIRITRI